MNCWQRLGIEETDNKKIIKRAYASVIKTIDPENQTELFQQVREAYEACIYQAGFSSYQQTYQETESHNLESSENQENITDSLNDKEVDKKDLEQVDLSIDEETNQQPVETQFAKVDFESGSSSVSSLQALEESPEDIASAFIEKLRHLYLDKGFVDRRDWIPLLDQDELQYIEVSNLLKIRLFQFFLDVFEDLYSKQYPDYEEIDPYKLFDLLNEELIATIKAFADFFDWENNELILSDYFDHQQMQSMASLYNKHSNKQSLDLPEKKSGIFKNVIFWFVFIFILQLLFAYMEEKETLSQQEYQQNKINDLKAEKQRNTCLWLSNIKSDEIALTCEQKLRFEHITQRFVLAYYWITRYQKDKENDKLDSESEKMLDKGIQFLKEAAEIDYIPAINLLAAVYNSVYFGRKDKKLAYQYLEKGSELGDVKSKILLAIINYRLGQDDDNLWKARDRAKSYDYFDQVGIGDGLDSKQKYVLGAALLLKLKHPEENHDISSAELAKKYFARGTDVDPRYLNLVAWFYTITRGEYRDPKFGLQLAQEFRHEKRHQKDWTYVDTLAAAWAMNEEYYQATKYMDLAISFIDNQLDEAKSQEGKDNQKYISELESEREYLLDTRKKYAKRQTLTKDFSVENLDDIFVYYFEELYITYAKEIDE